jgi:two-component system CheB/CheR fusion protein
VKKTGKLSPTDTRESKHKEHATTAVRSHFHIVGVGASAGGLKAFEDFFAGMPDDADLGMAFVLVQHLSPDHKSILSDLIRRYTSMPVFEVVDGMKVQPNCIYIIPPKYDMAFFNGSLQLLDPVAPHGQRLAIDFFFRSLANDQRERAIALVLSGTGSDGTLGIRAIKGEGGMVMVQAPESAEFDGMPHSAIDSGIVDYKLSPAEMGVQLIAYVSHFTKNLAAPLATYKLHTDCALKKIFVLLRDQTSHDFSQYKPSTINRRIERRLAVHQIQDINNYIQFLQHTPGEIEALFYDLLIGVTHFFRDASAFTYFEEHVIPKLFDDVLADKVIRIWCVGCSTGEEAYSIAILLRERMETLKKEYKVQLFATDIDARAIVTARAGLYPASISRDVSPERLAHFFSVEADGTTYRIHKVIRDMLIFSEQDVIKDPPFSKLDLLCCRNLLIYLNARLQEKLLMLFHYALRPSGILMLGTSEGIGKADMLFAVLNRKQKIFKRKDDFQGMPRTALKAIESIKLGQNTDSDWQAFPLQNVPTSRISLRELTERALITKLAPVSVLVRANGDILYLHGHSGVFLELMPGEVAVNNVLKMAREGLRKGLREGLLKAVHTKDIVRCPGLNVKSNGHLQHINITLCPVMVDATLSSDLYLYLIIMENLPVEKLAITSPASKQNEADTDTDAKLELRLAALQEELRSKDQYLLFTQDELETTNQELKSSNEEMQSINEELQSTNEELETSKEELQSINEELGTVNNELQTKVSDLSVVNNDMNNLLAGSRIATVFVNHRLRILRFTPTAYIIINLIPGDVGRPVGHIVSNLVDYKSLVPDIQEVLDTLKPKEIDVQTLDGSWYTMHIQPYRTLDNVIEGAVISFIDITEVRRVQAELGDSESQFRALFENVPFGVAYHKMIYDSSGNACDYRFLETNESYQILAGIDPQYKTVREVFPGIEKDPFDWIGTFEQVVKTGKKVRFEQRLRPGNCWCDCIALRYKPDHLVAVFINITAHKQAEEYLSEREVQLRQLKAAASVKKD